MSHFGDSESIFTRNFEKFEKEETFFFRHGIIDKFIIRQNLILEFMETGESVGFNVKRSFEVIKLKVVGR